MAPLERWLTIQQVCELVQVHEQTVRRWLNSGELPGRNLRGKAGWRIRESDLEDFMRKQKL
jgi:excisionase family DNA binding protein